MKLRGTLGKMYGFVHEVYQEFVRDDAILLSAAISFYAVSSLIPLLLLAVAIGAYLLGSPSRAENLVLHFVGQYVPSLAGEGEPGIREFVANLVKGRGTATGIGVIVLVWAGTSMIANLGTALNKAWETGTRRGFLVSRLIALLVLGATLILLGISVIMSTVLDILRRSNVAMLGLRPRDVPFLLSALGYLVPLLITIMAFALIYKILPNTRVRFRTALLGGAFSGVLWEVAKIGFSSYVTHYAARNEIYGSLGAIILLMVWISYTSIVTLLGAEVATVWAKRHPSAERGVH